MDEMKNEQQFIQDIDRLVPRPDIALQVLRLAHDEQSNIQEMATKIEMDPNLTANMLRLANSAYFGHMREITSIQQILVRLGLETVKMIAITGASVGLMNSPQQAYNLEPGALWRHSHATAVLAGIIAEHARLKETSAIYTASLLHDIGKVVLNRPLQVAISNAIKVGKKFHTLIELETALLGTNHARVGMALLRKWGLPEEIYLPVGRHHLRLGDINEQPLHIRIVSLANDLVESIGIRAQEPESVNFDIQEFIDQNLELPEVPDFQENMEKIINTFFYRFQETTQLV